LQTFYAVIVNLNLALTISFNKMLQNLYRAISEQKLAKYKLHYHSQDTSVYKVLLVPKCPRHLQSR